MAIISFTLLQTKYGDLDVKFHQFKINFNFETCLSISSGDLTKPNCIVRVHSSCLFSETLGSIDCDCKIQLEKSLQLIAEKGGVIIYLYQEGRGLGLVNKIKAMEVERTEGVDTADAYTHLHFDLDPRKYTIAIKTLRELGVSKHIKLISNNPHKRMQLEEGGFHVSKKIKLLYPHTKIVAKYLKTKKEKLGHEI